MCWERCSYLLYLWGQYKDRETVRFGSGWMAEFSGWTFERFLSGSRKRTNRFLDPGQPAWDGCPCVFCCWECSSIRYEIGFHTHVT